MCGIYGSTQSSGYFERFASKELENRGPDSKNVTSVNGCELGFSRLSIVGLEGGGQPVTENGDIFFLFNGEIYNWESFRQSSSTYSSLSDASVLPDLYGKKGDSFVESLDGMFAIAVIDFNKNAISLFRDRLGKKPLYYSFFDGSFWFCSRLTVLAQIAQSKNLKLSVNKKWLQSYLMFGSGEHLPDTVFDQIRRVVPGGVVKFDIRNGGISEKKWTRPLEFELMNNSSVGEADLWEALLGETQKRVPSEVTFGLQLSGGLDSSLISAALFDLGHKSHKAYTLDTYSPDVKRAQNLASIFGLEHSVVKLPREGDELKEESLAALNTLDEPFWDGYLSSFFLNREASREHKVMFSGDGPDELFFGYERTRTAIRLGPFASLIGKNQLFATTAQKLLKSTSKNLEAFRDWTAREQNLPSPLQLWLLMGLTPAKLEDLGLEFKSLTENLPEGAKAAKATRDFIWFTEVEIHLAQVLKKVDSSSMQNGLEVRSPFLGDVFLREAFQRRGHINRAFFGKRELQKIASERLTLGVPGRKKNGFSFPIQDLLRELTSDLQERILNGASPLEQVFGSALTPMGASLVDFELNPRILGRLVSLELYLNKWTSG